MNMVGKFVPTGRDVKRVQSHVSTRVPFIVRDGVVEDGSEGLRVRFAGGEVNAGSYLKSRFFVDGWWL